MLQHIRTHLFAHRYCVDCEPPNAQLTKDGWFDLRVTCCRAWHSVWHNVAVAKSPLFIAHWRICTYTHFLRMLGSLSMHCFMNSWGIRFYPWTAVQVRLLSTINHWKDLVPVDKILGLGTKLIEPFSPDSSTTNYEYHDEPYLRRIFFCTFVS